jgi:arginine decarboxylase
MYMSRCAIWLPCNDRAAEQITPYPPGIAAVVPGELLHDAVIDYLRSGLKAGMVLPDPADPELAHIRVVAAH